jgi:hypothetical protein
MGVSITNLHPGFVRTEMVELMVAGGVDANASISMDIPRKRCDTLQPAMTRSGIAARSFSPNSWWRRSGCFRKDRNGRGCVPGSSGAKLMDALMRHAEQLGKIAF